MIEHCLIIFFSTVSHGQLISQTGVPFGNVLCTCVIIRYVRKQMVNQPINHYSSQ